LWGNTREYTIFLKVISVKINNENIVAITLPYPSERRLNEVILKNDGDKEIQQTYSQKIGEIFTQLQSNFEKDSINIAVSHLFVTGGESIMLRGIIDAYFEEDGKIVLVDYKTDFVNEENKDQVINRYKKQLDLYKNVLEELTGKEVKEKYVYLFGIDEGISI